MLPIYLGLIHSDKLPLTLIFTVLLIGLSRIINSVMRSTAFGKSSYRSNVSSGSNLPSINKIVSSPSAHSISHQLKFNPSEQFGNSSEVEKYWDPAYRSQWNDYYEGEYRNGKKWGRGSYWYQNGDFYHGFWQNDQPQGRGLLYFYQSDNPAMPLVYSGNFDHGLFHGFGKLFKMVSKYQSLTVYQGNWKQGQRDGTGKQFYNFDQFTHYSGSWQDDDRHGPGILVFPGGQFEGGWDRNTMQGQGKLTLKNNNTKTVFQGIWNNDQLTNGLIRYYSSGNNVEMGSYSGGIQNYLRHGHGVYENARFSYESDFVEDAPVGRGHLISKKGGIGELESWKMVGDLVSLKDISAQLFYFNQDKYEGLVDIRPQYQNNLVYRTKGVYTFRDGQAFEGRFEDNSQGEMQGDYMEVKLPR